MEYPFCNIAKAVPRNLTSYFRGSLAFSVIILLIHSGLSVFVFKPGRFLTFDLSEPKALNSQWFLFSYLEVSVDAPYMREQKVDVDVE